MTLLSRYPTKSVFWDLIDLNSNDQIIKEEIDKKKWLSIDKDITIAQTPRSLKPAFILHAGSLCAYINEQSSIA